MKNYKVEEYKKNRNSLRYLLTNPFQESPFKSLISFFNQKGYYITNKVEENIKDVLTLTFKVRKKTNNYSLKILVSKDHLITLTLTYQKTNYTKKSRSLQEILNYIEENAL